MTIGPAPMIMMDLMSVRFGMIVTRLIKSFSEAQEHAIRVLQDIVVPEADDVMALRSKPRRPCFIIFQGIAMLTTIDFDDEVRLRTEEVYDVWPDRCLTTKAMAVELFQAQQRP